MGSRTLVLGGGGQGGCHLIEMASRFRISVTVDIGEALTVRVYDFEAAI